MKKYMVRTDIEGITGIVSYDQSVPGHAEYAEGRELFMGDLLALLQGLFEGGADEVYLYDEHCAGRNIRIDQLPPHVYTYMGKPMYRETRPPYIRRVSISMPFRSVPSGCSFVGA